MANVPPSRRLLQEDFPDQAEWIEKLLQPINAYMEQSAAAMKSLTVSENMQGDMKEVELDGTFPVRVSWNGPKPVSVLVGKLTKSDNSDTNHILTTTGTLTSGSNVIATLDSVTGLKAGQKVSGTGIADDTHVVSISGFTLTMSKNATATTVNGSLSFSLDQAVQVRWEYDQSGSLAIQSVTGITPTPSMKYKLILECKAK